MFQDLSLWELTLKGGWTMLVLAIFSIISWYIIFEKILRFRKIKIDIDHFMIKINKFIAGNKIIEAADLCQETPGPIAATLKSGLRQYHKGISAAREAMQRTRNLERLRLEQRLSLLATIGSVSPFIGLFGTVLGIINAFSALGTATEAGAAIVSNGIAEALVATAGGLFTAIPAVMAYNLFVRKIVQIDTEMSAAGSEILESIEVKNQSAPLNPSTSNFNPNYTLDRS